MRPVSVLRPAPLVTAAAVLAGVVTPVLVGGPAGAGLRPGRVTADYTCTTRQPSTQGSATQGTATQGTGTQEPAVATELTVTLVQDLPTVAEAGSPVQPGTLTIGTTLPAGLAAPGALQGSADLTVSARTGPHTLQLPWNGLPLAATTAPAQGSVPLTFTGSVPALDAGGPGTMTLSPAALALHLGTLTLDCTPKATPGSLGSIVFTTAGPTTSPSTTAGASPAASPRPATTPTAAPRLAVRAPADAAAPTPSGPCRTPTGHYDPKMMRPYPTDTSNGNFLSVLPGPSDPPLVTSYGLECAYAAGYSNVGKLGQAALINDPKSGAVLANLMMIRNITYVDMASGAWYLQNNLLGNLRLKPTRTTFLTYGFVPTTATMQLVPTGPLSVLVEQDARVSMLTTTTISGEQILRLSDVRVNGTPLDVGPHCQTRTPVRLRLVGYDRSQMPGADQTHNYSVQNGGVLTQDDLVIPKFSGCGSKGEDLDPLFDAAVSGSGNSLNLVQGVTCFALWNTGCTPIATPLLPVRKPAGSSSTSVPGK